MNNNNAILYHGLFIFRNTVVPFVTRQLQSVYGDKWWKVGVESALGPTVVEGLEKQFERRYDKKLTGIRRPGSELHEMLDINHLLPIIQHSWKVCFGATFKDRTVTEVWLGEIIDVRNAVAHPTSQPVSDDDTWRNLDTMTRFVRLIDPDAAKEIEKVRRNAREAVAVEARPTWLDLREGPFDYGHGIAQLQQLILREESKDSEIYLKFVRHCDQLTTALWERRLKPGVQDGQLESRIQSVLQELDRLALQYAGVAFTDLCITFRGPSAAQDALPRIQHLQREIESLQSQLQQKQWKRLAQQQTGEVVLRLERETAHIQEKLDSKRKELADLVETSAPPVHLSVHRMLDSDGKKSYVEEEMINVTVSISNEGYKSASVLYNEKIPESFVLASGGLHLEGDIEPSEAAALSYSCYPTRAGEFILSTACLEYTDRISEWDHIDDVTIQVRPGTEPKLIASRHHRLEENGLKLLVYMENRGDKIARNVKYKETLAISGREDPIEMNWEGSIRGGGAGQTVECFFDVSDLGQVHFPEIVQITYNDSHGATSICALQAESRRLDYRFPVATDTSAATVGRDAEIKILSSAVDRVWKLSHGKADPLTKRLLFIRGIEGTGKTRLVYELLHLAQQRGFDCYVEDAKDRNPVKRMLRRLLGLRPDEKRDEVISSRLEEALPGEEHNLRREVIFRFISTIPERYNEESLALLEAHVMVLIRLLCHGVPKLLVFENIHWTPEGTEEQLLLALLNSVLVSRDEPMLLCLTYRPQEKGSAPVVGKLKMSSADTEWLWLEPIRKEAVRSLVDKIIDFPRFGEPLHRYAEEWSAGNPLYLIELLRLLTNPNSHYLVRVGSEWYPAPEVRLEEAIPQTIGEVILERVNLELASEADLARTLSAIGFELPLKLVESLIGLEFPKWSGTELNRHLDTLQQAGILSLVGPESYEFEHQLKREVLYESLAQPVQAHLRQHIAEILLTQDIYRSPEEQVPQLARHIVKSPRDFQLMHLEQIRKAADLEQGRRNFARSLDFYGAALDLVPQESFEAADLLLERSRIHQLCGNWLSAERDLNEADRLVASESTLTKSNSKRTARIRIQVMKQQAQVLLKQPQASLDRANTLLFQARKGLEGMLPFNIVRFFLPRNLDLYQDLLQIYLALAEVFLRKRDFKTCEKVCRRADWIARNAMEKWPDRPLIHEVHQALGDLHLERGSNKEDYEEACRWYELALQNVKDDPYRQERVWLRLADAYRVLEDAEHARETYEKAIQVQRRLGDTHGLALSFGGIGDIFVEEGDFDKGRYYCEQAYQYQQLVSDVDRFWRTCISLTKICLNDGNISLAAEYWWRARPILFGQRRIDAVGRRKQREIYDLIRIFSDHFRQLERWEELRGCLRDLDNLASEVVWEKDEIAGLQMEVGEVNLKTQRWSEAISAFERAFKLAEMPVTQARALEGLGDVYSTYEPPTHWQMDDSELREQAQDKAEGYFEEAVTVLVRSGDFRRALGVYEKLLTRIITDESGLLQLPFTYLRILRVIPLQKQFIDQFVNRAEEMLLRNERYSEAGDIVVYTARELAKDDENAIPFEDKLAYLRRAEAIYRRGKPEVIIAGLNMIIPTYFRFRLWNEVTRCFEELFELSIQTKDSEEFLETFWAVGELREELEAGRLEAFIDTAQSGSREMNLSLEQQTTVSLYTAKWYSYIADESEETDQQRKYEDLALQFYSKVQQAVAEETSIMAVVLNDTALIHQEREEYSEALRKLERAIAIDERISSYRGAAQSRINRARVYRDLEKPDQARTDYEQAIGILLRIGETWRERLQSQDERPLDPEEIVAMRYDKKWLASAFVSYASFLLLSEGDARQAQELALQSSILYQELGMAENATEAKSFAAAASVHGGGSVFELLTRKSWPCPSCQRPIFEGMTACSSCGQLVCPKCGAAVGENAAVCPRCLIELDLVRSQSFPEVEEPTDYSSYLTCRCARCGGLVDLERGRCVDCDQAVCPECGAMVGDDDAVCPACGTELVLFCPACNREVSARDTKCPYCGELFSVETESHLGDQDLNALCPRCGEQIELGQGRCPNCSQAICPECGALLGEDNTVCPTCKTELILSCPECGQVMTAADRTCPHCGELFDEGTEEE